MAARWLNGFYGVADFEGAAAGHVGEHAALAFYFGAQAVSDALDEGAGFAAMWFPPSVAMPGSIVQGGCCLTPIRYALRLRYSMA